ncbi:helix-turn-helix transcriptional regulator [Streptomyces malaysiensis subsp. malaysiensis]|uniref:helix-turn-helix domain-containing protein n=1 Tax=Streptomyces malaysiensis TaxID=92644 RepID=UPI0024BF1A90|nr:helix-turn-helix transcriptional regulator [Streptomyces sp. NA07423]WHX18574.1 helix-turn-helix transcriptional regulator [Streptomyces sp. NA07423]
MSEPTGVENDGALGLGEGHQPDTGPEPEVNSVMVRVFGRQLKCCRLRAGLERPEFASMVGYSVSTIAAYEQGRRIPPPRLIDQADEVLDAGGVLLEMKEEMEKAQYPPFFQDAARFETEAVELHVYGNQAAPGLLQTKEYAQEVFRMWRPLLEEETIEQRLAARLERQAIFARRPRPQLSFVIEEAVLHRRIGGDQAWREQLEQILLIGQERNVDVQAMPLNSGLHAGLAGPFTLMEVKDGRRIAYTEVQSDSRLHTERKRVRELEVTYGCLRAQALTPKKSLALIEKLLREG